MLVFSLGGRSAARGCLLQLLAAELSGGAGYQEDAELHTQKCI